MKKKGSAKKYHLEIILKNHELWIEEQLAGQFSNLILDVNRE